MNIPIRVLPAFAFLVCCLYGCGSNGSAVAPPPSDADKTIALKIQNGTGLTYKISPTEGVTYSLDLTFHELSPKLSFDFVMTNMDYSKGVIEIDETARKTSHILSTELPNGKSILTDRTSMVLSLEVYRDLLEASKANIFLDNEGVEFEVISNEDYKFDKGNGKVTETVMHCANKDKTQQIWVWKNPELPLIMKMSGKSNFELTYWYLPGERP